MILVEDESESDIEDMALEFFTGLHDYIQWEYMEIKELAASKLTSIVNIVLD